MSKYRRVNTRVRKNRANDDSVWQKFFWEQTFALNVIGGVNLKARIAEATDKRK